MQDPIERYYEKPSDSFVQSLAKGLAVIDCFNQGQPTQTLSQVAHNTGLTPAGARRLLLTLVKLGYMRLQGRLFCLTPKVLSLGKRYLDPQCLAGLAKKPAGTGLPDS